MPEYTKQDALNDAIKETEPIREKQGKRTKKIFENIGTIVTVSIIILSMVLFAYNNGFSSIYNLPATALSLDISRFIPSAVQLMGVIVYIFMYISSVLSDKITKSVGFSITRILLGCTICSYLIYQNNLNYALGFISLIIIILLPIIVELIVILVNKKKNKPIKNKKYDKETYEYKKKEFISNAIFPHYTIKKLVLVVAFAVCISPVFGMINASTKMEYQVFKYNGETYAVIADRSDTLLVQKAAIYDDILHINTSCYYYLPKENQELVSAIFKGVDISKQKNDQILEMLQSTQDQVQ